MMGKPRSLSLQFSLFSIFVLVPLLFSGCAGLALSARSSVPIGEVPLGEYDVKAFLALAPTIQGDGELTAAVVYTNPGGPRIEVRPTPSIFGILDRPLGRRGTGREHLTMVKSM